MADRMASMWGAAVAYAFERIYQPEVERSPLPSPIVRRSIVDQFNRLYYHSPEIPWRNTFYRGVPVAKAPTDLWAYQEIISETRPAWIVETGTQYGGSAYYIADLCELLGHGRVVSVDIAAKPGLPDHPRVTYLAGSSTEPAIVEQVRAMVVGGPVMVILDSDHSYSHVRAELDLYAPLVSDDSYLIVEDTNVNGHPVLPTHGPGPTEAVEEFLTANQEFEVDPSRERFLLTFNPRGYLRRRSAP
jgi:cephalosporin hydroxylase